MDCVEDQTIQPVVRSEDDPRWNILVNRQADANLDFVYGVLTTGVYCKPFSPTKLPRPENVLFFDTAAEAERAGFRPSKRNSSNPEVVAQKHAAAVAEACRLIDAR